VIEKSQKLVTDKKYILTGNPIRESILHGSKNKGYEITGFTSEKPIVLVWGGSQGAQQINEVIERNFHNLKHHFQIIHITGTGKKTNIQNSAYCNFEYISDDLKHIYAITDFVIGRAGANSIYEVALMEKPNILIPLKNADQLKNAEYFEKEGASIVLGEGHNIYEILVALLNNPTKQESMKVALRRVAKPNAVEKIAEMILNIRWRCGLYSYLAWMRFAVVLFYSNIIGQQRETSIIHKQQP